MLVEVSPKENVLTMSQLGLNQCTAEIIFIMFLHFINHMINQENNQYANIQLVIISRPPNECWALIAVIPVNL